MNTHDVAKALEVWTLQNLLNLSILLGILALGLAMAGKYLQALEKRLTLRVSIEIWQVFSVLLVDVFLVVVVLAGFAVLNPDIMADIKVAVPFVPAAVVLFALALYLRLFKGGHQVSSRTYKGALWAMFFANLLNILGFTLVMEAPGEEYLALHPSPFWTFVRAHLRSNASPHGLELAQLSFYVCFPLLVLLFLLAFKESLKGTGEK
ncbi:MAG TPA: hypothetical protein ENJ97_04295 [Planctomycetes bacterium]|nr:hypothetical protein [Planctomycetota bacterium]